MSSLSCRSSFITALAAEKDDSAALFHLFQRYPELPCRLISSSGVLHRLIFTWFSSVTFDDEVNAARRNAARRNVVNVTNVADDDFRDAILANIDNLIAFASSLRHVEILFQLFSSDDVHIQHCAPSYVLSILCAKEYEYDTEMDEYEPRNVERALEATKIAVRFI